MLPCCLLLAPAVIVESTYGVSKHLPRDQREQRFIEKVRGILVRGGRVLLPVVALGRAQVLRNSPLLYSGHFDAALVHSYGVTSHWYIRQLSWQHISASQLQALGTWTCTAHPGQLSVNPVSLGTLDWGSQAFVTDWAGCIAGGAADTGGVLEQ